MISILNNYLLQHKSVSIPGIGTIYIERTPAQSDFINKQILPPSFHYRFDKYYDSPEKDFFTFLAHKRNIADYEAIQYYNQWAQELKNELRNLNDFVWTGVGKLRQDISGEIILEPDGAVPSHLQPVPAVRVLHTNAKHTMLVGDKEITNVQMSEYLNEETHVERESWWIYAAIITAIALVGIFFYFSKHGSNIESTANQQKVSVR